METLKSDKIVSFIITIIIGISIPANIFADGVDVMEIPGNTVIPIQNDDVRMTKEIVTLNEDNEVKTVFAFENETEKDISFTMGFPFKKDADPLSVPYGVPGSGKFGVRINGKEIKFDKKEVSANTKLSIGGEYAFMYIWPISFKPHEKKIVECIYTASWTCDAGPFPPCSHFTYITKTGALWKDTIGQADFYIALSDDYIKKNKERKLDFDIRPSNYKIVNKTVEWHFKDWEPTEDITINATRSSSYPLEDFELMRMMMDILDLKREYEGNRRLYTVKDLQDHAAVYNETVERFYIKILRNEIFARHGKIFKNGNLQAVFNSRNWYISNPDYSDKMLNEYERKNIRFILDYEKEKGWIK